MQRQWPCTESAPNSSAQQRSLKFAAQSKPFQTKVSVKDSATSRRSLEERSPRRAFACQAFSCASSMFRCRSVTRQAVFRFSFQRRTILKGFHVIALRWNPFLRVVGLANGIVFQGRDFHMQRGRCLRVAIRRDFDMQRGRGLRFAIRRDFEMQRNRRVVSRIDFQMQRSHCVPFQRESDMQRS